MTTEPPAATGAGPGAEAAAARDAAILADLSHNALLAVTGDDATAFLHAQLTSDVQALPVDGAQWSGWCTPKGRLLATFLLVRRANGYLLMLPAEIAAPVARRLGMFVLRSRAKIADASAELARLGLAGPKAAAAVARHWGAAPAPLRVAERDGALCVALDAQRFVLVVPAGQAAALRASLAGDALPAGAAAWEWGLIQAGIPTVVAATQEAFVPQMANFDLIGAVSFRKGCYPGQEIVARTQYRGILKRRMARVHVDGAQAPAPGQPVYSSAFGDQAAGQVANAAPAPEGGFDALVVAQIEGLERGDLRWNAPDGPPLEIRWHPGAPS